MKAHEERRLRDGITFQAGVSEDLRPNEGQI